MAGRGRQSPFVERDDVEAMLDAVQRGAVEHAKALVLALRDRNITHDDLVADLLVEVQARSGACWERNEWSVGQEHAATAVVEAMLGMIAVSSETTGWRGRVAVSCVEGEWHTMPARLLTERLRLRGWSTVFLGQSMPPSHLQRFVASGDFTAVILSCQVAMNLTGGLGSVSAVHRAGLPVVIGGAGMGPDAMRATSIGADAWCESIEELEELLDQWILAPPAALADDRTEPEHLRLLDASADVVQTVMDNLAGTIPELTLDANAQLLQWRGDVAAMVQFLAASVLTSDPRVLGDLLPWMEVVLTSRGVSPRTLLVAVDALEKAVPASCPRARQLLSEVIRAQ